MTTIIRAKPSKDNALNFYTDSKDLLWEKWKRFGDNCYIFVRHYSSTIDDEEYVKAHGLLSLKTLLKDGSSPLSIFLKDRGVEIDFTNRILSFNGEKKSVDSMGAISVLRSKLFSKTSQSNVECFFFDNKEEPYSCVRYCPEILSSIDDAINEGPIIKRIDLCHEWIRSCRRVVYDFLVPITLIRNDEGGPLPDCVENYIGRRFRSNGLLPPNGDCVAIIEEGIDPFSVI